MCNSERIWYRFCREEKWWYQAEKRATDFLGFGRGVCMGIGYEEGSRGSRSDGE